MIAQLTHIEVPKEWESTNDWDSHKGLLYLALKNTKGEVVEMGIGYGSTPLISKYCEEKGRTFTTYESNIDWLNKMKKVHCVKIFISDYMEVDENPDLLFIDCAPGDIRKELINKYRSKADVIIVHDSEITSDYVYGLRNILNTFEYRLDYKPEGKPSTTCVSNVINVSQWAFQL